MLYRELVQGDVVHGFYYFIVFRKRFLGMRQKRKVMWGSLTLILMLMMSSITVFAEDAEEVAEYVPNMYASFWALVPAIVAIALALLTKEVYSSLFVGILLGGVFYSNFTLETTVTHVFQDGIVGYLSES